MHHPARRKMLRHIVLLLMLYQTSALSINVSTSRTNDTDDIDNNIIDFDSEYDRPNKKYGPGDVLFNKANRYTIVKVNATEGTETFDITTDLNVIPLELLSTTEETVTLSETTTELDLTVIPLSSNTPFKSETTTETIIGDTTEVFDDNLKTTTVNYKIYIESQKSLNTTVEDETENNVTTTTTNIPEYLLNTTAYIDDKHNITTVNTTNVNKTRDNSTEEGNPHIFTELDIEDEEVPEDYYDAKDVIPTKPPSNDALTVIFGLAGSVVESVAERVVPRGIFDLFKRMQKQSEALEAERLRSREENGGIGQFGRGILKSISTSISKPFTALMGGVKDIGSLDTDRGFVSSAAAGVSNVANSLGDAFKNRVQAIYPGTLWCGDGHSAQARSGDLGLFFFTDTCCRQHDACKIYIRAGETKYGLTNTGLFTRSHCSCDAQFRECLRKTNSLVSAQIGLTYFNVLGPQCLRRAHPIVRCLRKTRITGQKCEEYELDYTKEKMWQWFDNETY